MGNRNLEFTLALIGGIFGFFGSIFAIIIGAFGSAFTIEGSSLVVYLGWIGILFSIIGIVGAILVNYRPKISAWLMIISAVGGIISISMAYLLPFVLLLGGGILTLIRKK